MFRKVMFKLVVLGSRDLTRGDNY